MNNCPVCLREDGFRSERVSEPDVFEIHCPLCGTYRIDGTTAATNLGSFEPRYQLSGIIRNRFVRGEKVQLHSAVLENIFSSVNIPDDPFGKIDLLLEHIALREPRIDNYAHFDPNLDFPLLYAQDYNEFLFYSKHAGELGYIEKMNLLFRLSLEGWRRLAELKERKRISSQAFVAMWFDNSLDLAWKEGFEPALTQTGFKPIRIDLQEHNEKICDRIIAEVRKSGLLVADFTGQRGGVYFEAGFAMGLGIPVIWTCREDHIKELHFDTRQYNHICWNSPEDLHRRLVNRIEATIPRVTSGHERSG